MKALITIGLVIGLTGCGTVQQIAKNNFTPSVDLAKEECSKIGFVYGSPQYQNCVMQQTQSIRNDRVARAAISAQTAPTTSFAPTITQCYRTGSYINCTSN